MNYFQLLTNFFRLLPIGLKGKDRLARYLFNKNLNDGDRSIVARDSSKYLVPSLNEPVGFYLLIDGIYEKSAIDFIIKILPPGGTFLDIGANIGVFTITVAQFMQKTGCVIGIEASPKIFDYLQKNVESNHLDNVRIFEYAVTDVDNSYVSFYEPPVDHFGMGSMAPQFHEHPIQVKTKQIDTLLSEIDITDVDVIKIDVEGYEAMVFKGAKQLLSQQNAPTILFEFCDWAEERVPELEIGAAQRILAEYGYQIWRLNDLIQGKSAMKQIMTQGCDTLIGIKNGN
jgi:FkbM family methyltransferase